MDLNHKDGKLRVNYSDRLVTLLREVRQLSSIGFAVPAKIQQVSNTAQRFYRHGVILKQVSFSILTAVWNYFHVCKQLWFKHPVLNTPLS